MYPIEGTSQSLSRNTTFHLYIYIASYYIHNLPHIISNLLKIGSNIISDCFMTLFWKSDKPDMDLTQHHNIMFPNKCICKKRMLLCFSIVTHISLISTMERINNKDDNSSLRQVQVLSM